jgi:glycogen debranching enzyme
MITLDEATPTNASDAAVKVLRGNWRAGYSHKLRKPYEFTCPSPDIYPFQWSWDSCFHAIALTHVDPDKAKSEISTLLLGADSGGFLPHMLLWPGSSKTETIDAFRIALWDEWRTATIGPPVLARAVYHVYRSSGDWEWLSAVLPAVVRLYDWLAAVRAGADGLLLIKQPDESGLDSSPKYDSALGLVIDSRTLHADWHTAMRQLIEHNSVDEDPRVYRHGHFVWVDVLVNTVYADSLTCLARLLGERGGRFALRAQAVLESLIHRCWDDHRGVFWDLNDVTGRPATVLTASSLFPLVLPNLPHAIVDRLLAHLLNEDEFWLPFPVASVAATEPSFDPTFATGSIFRGSTWINLNWYLHLGLRAHGKHEIAAELARRTISLAAQSGLRECYGPYDAAGQGAHKFGWSALVLDLLNGHQG